MTYLAHLELPLEKFTSLKDINLPILDLRKYASLATRHLDHDYRASCRYNQLHDSSLYVSVAVT